MENQEYRNLLLSFKVELFQSFWGDSDEIEDPAEKRDTKKDEKTIWALESFEAVTQWFIGQEYEVKDLVQPLICAWFKRSVPQTMDLALSEVLRADQV